MSFLHDNPNVLRMLLITISLAVSLRSVKRLFLSCVSGKGNVITKGCGQAQHITERFRTFLHGVFHDTHIAMLEDGVPQHLHAKEAGEDQYSQQAAQQNTVPGDWVYFASCSVVARKCITGRINASTAVISANHTQLP